MKALSIRLDDDLGKKLEEVCRKTGYKKNTLVTRLIAAFVRKQQSLTLSGKKKADPFEEVIGLLKSDPLLTTPQAIDEAVYDL